MKRILASILLASAISLVAADAPKTSSNIEIRSDEFVFSSEQRTGVYTGNVRLIDPPDMELTCEKMTANLAETGGGIEKIIAEESVVIKLYELQNGKRVLRTAKGRKAVYEAASNRVTLTGESYIEVAEGKLTADEVILDRTSGSFRARGGVLTIHPQALGKKKATDAK